jgi:site-specific DNA recombinase
MNDKQRKIHTELVALASSKNGRVLTDYASAFEDVQFECYNGHKFSNLVNNIRNGEWCTVCQTNTLPQVLYAVLNELDLSYTENYILPEAPDILYSLKLETKDKIVIHFDTHEALEDKNSIAEKIWIPTEMAKSHNYRVVRIDHVSLANTNKLTRFIWDSIKSNEKICLSNPELYNFDAEDEKEPGPEELAEALEKIVLIEESEAVIPQGKQALVGYVRVSTLRQGEKGVSLQAQEAKIRQFAKEEGFVVRKVYRDVGISGKNFSNRPGLLSMMEDLKSDDIVCVQSVSRFARNMLQAAQLEQQIRTKKAYFRTITERIETVTINGRVMFGIHCVIAQAENEQHGERVSIGMNHKSGRGEMRTKPPFGKKFVGKDVPWEIDTEEIKTIEKIIGLRAKEPYMTLSQMCRTLDGEKIKCRNAKKWYTTRLKVIMEQNGVPTNTYSAPDSKTS